MPISNQENRRRIHHRAPPQYLSRGQRKILLFFLKWIIMVVVIAIFLFFLGFAAVVLFHLLLLSNTINRRCTRFFQPNSAAAASAEGLPPMQDIFPVVAYSAAIFPRRSDCAICLDSFEEGDECRNLPVCKHLFHAKCVDRWIRKKPTCPVCRTRIDLDPAGLEGSRIWEDDRWMRLWAIDFEEGTSY